MWSWSLAFLINNGQEKEATMFVLNVLAVQWNQLYKHVRMNLIDFSKIKLDHILHNVQRNIKLLLPVITMMPTHVYVYERFI